MREFPNIEIKDNLESYNEEDLRFIAKELNIINCDKLSIIDLTSEINKKQTKDTVNDILRRIDTSRTTAGMTGLLLDFWFRALKKSKWTTSILTIIFFSSLVFTINFLHKKDTAKIEKVKKESFGLGNRIKELENIENSLKRLVEFIDIQKIAIIQTEQSLKILEKKKIELEPIVSTQKEIVEAIFREQEKRNFENRWIERLVGFGLGIAASVIASIIYGLIIRIKTSNKV